MATSQVSLMREEDRAATSKTTLIRTEVNSKVSSKAKKVSLDTQPETSVVTNPESLVAPSRRLRDGLVETAEEERREATHHHNLLKEVSLKDLPSSTPSSKMTLTTREDCLWGLSTEESINLVDLNKMDSLPRERLSKVE
jgi:cytoskeletal protein RodZ